MHKQRHFIISRPVRIGTSAREKQVDICRTRRKYHYPALQAGKAACRYTEKLQTAISKYCPQAHAKLFELRDVKPSPQKHEAT